MSTYQFAGTQPRFLTSPGPARKKRATTPVGYVASFDVTLTRQERRKESKWQKMVILLGYQGLLTKVVLTNCCHSPSGASISLMSNSDAIPMVHLSVIANALDWLGNLGVPLAAGLSASRMPSRILDDRSGYVPFRPSCEWISRMARGEGVDNIGLQIGESAAANVLQPAIKRKILASPTLYQGIYSWADLVARESSHASIWVEDQGGDLRLWFSSTFDQSVPGQAEWIWYAVLMHINVVRLFLGPTWCPKEMVVPESGPGLTVAKELFPETRLHTNPVVTGLTIPRNACRAAPLQSGFELPGGLNQILPAPPVDLLSSLNDMVMAYLPDGAPPIELAAEAAGTSVRTLERHLGVHSLTYKRLIASLRFNKAKELLGHRDLSVTEISRQLGYKHASHFSRAFRRMAGQTPMAYRRALFRST